MRGRTVAERNRRLSLPLHRDGGGPSLAKAPISFTLISASFFFVLFVQSLAASRAFVFAVFYSWLAHWRKGSCYEISMSDRAEAT